MKNLFKEILGEGYTQEIEEKIFSQIQQDYVEKQSFKEIEEKLQNTEASHKEELKQIRLQQAIESALSVYGAKNKKAVSALLDQAQIEIDENGTVMGIDEQIKSIQKSEGYLFEESKVRGLKPAETSDKAVKSPKEMSYGELCDFFTIKK